MRNAFMAVDTGFTLFFGFHVLFVRRLFLQFCAHGIKVVAIPAFARIVFLHASPFMTGQFKALGFKFFGGVNAARDFSPDLKTSKLLPRNSW